MAFHSVINENTTSAARLSTTSFPASRQRLGRADDTEALIDAVSDWLAAQHL
jgi:hypothetical protein